MKITAVLYVDAIEPSLEFWVDRMGFNKAVELPEGDKLGFVILTSGGAEVMLQSFANLAKDEPAFLPGPGEKPTGVLFLEVEDFEDALRRLQGYPVAMAERVTFYGMREIAVRDPGGHIVCFAKRVDPAAAR